MKARFDEIVNAALAVAVVMMVPFAFAMLLNKEIPREARDIIMMLVGVMAANATQAVQNRFGTTTGSTRKDATIETLANTASSAQAALTPITTTATVNSTAVTTTKAEESKT